MDLERCCRLVAGFELFRGFVYDDATWPSKRVTKDQCYLNNGQWRVISTGGVASIGFGETDAAYVEVHWDSGVTEAQAWDRLRARVQWFADGVEGLIDPPMTDHQHEAMTSLAYNIGLAGTANNPGFRESTVRRRFNAGDVAGAAEAFRMWVIPASLRDRREAEIRHFLTPDTEAAPVADLSPLHPIFRERVERACRETGATVFSAGRSTKRQRELFECWQAGNPNCNPANPPGTSWHEFGDDIPSGPYAYAVDFTTGPGWAENALAEIRRRSDEFGLVFNIRDERWHAQPAEISEGSRVHGAESRLPRPAPAPTGPEEDELFSESPIECIHLVAVHSRLLLTSTGDTHGSKVVQAKANGSLNQRWMVYGHEDGTLSFVNRAGDLALDRPDGETAAGTILQVAGTDFNINQRWGREQKGHVWRLWARGKENQGTNRLIDMAGNTSNEGDLAILWVAKSLEAEGWANQFFIAVPTR